LENIIGSFKGSILDDSWDLAPAITEFYSNDNGVLSGQFLAYEGEELVEGQLSEFQVESEYTLTATWRNKSREGKVRILFAEDYEMFMGFWGGDVNSVSFPWVGRKQ
jgi:hypothetical protein